MTNPASCSVPTSALSCDLHFNLSKHTLSRCTPEDQNAICHALTRDTTVAANTQDFLLDFSSRVKWISTLFAQFESQQNSSKDLSGVFAKAISSQVISGLEIFDCYHSESKTTCEVAQAVYAFARDLKRHESLRQTVWKTLPEKQQALLHRLTPWTEDLRVLSLPIFFQWLGNVDLGIARQEDETITDFGNGRLFRVLPPCTQDDETSFPLVNYPDHCLVKTTSAPMPFYSSVLLTPEKMGRMHETFDVSELELKIKEEEDNSALYKNQMMTLFACYRAALCNVFDLSAATPEALGEWGEWTIWPISKQPLATNASFSREQLTTLHRFFLIEKLWNIDVLGEEFGRFKAHWATCDGKLVQEGTLPLPTFLCVSIVERHCALLNRMCLNQVSQQIWAELEDESQPEYAEINLRMDRLQVLIDLHILTEAELKNPDAQTLLLIRLLKRINPVNVLQCSQDEIMLLKLEQRIGHFIQVCRQEPLTDVDYLVDSPMTEEEKFNCRLLCLRKASTLSHDDHEELDRLLQSYLHEEMTRKASQRFLDEFQQTLASSLEETTLI